MVEEKKETKEDNNTFGSGREKKEYLAGETRVSHWPSYYLLLLRWLLDEWTKASGIEEEYIAKQLAIFFLKKRRYCCCCCCRLGFVATFTGQTRCMLHAFDNFVHKRIVMRGKRPVRLLLAF